MLSACRDWKLVFRQGLSAVYANNKRNNDVLNTSFQKQAGFEEER